MLKWFFLFQINNFSFQYISCSLLWKLIISIHFIWRLIKTLFKVKVLLAVSMLCGDWTGVDKNWEMDICFDVCRIECNESMNLWFLLTVLTSTYKLWSFQILVWYEKDYAEFSSNIDKTKNKNEKRNCKWIWWNHREGTVDGTVAQDHDCSGCIIPNDPSVIAGPNNRWFILCPVEYPDK